MNISTAKMLLKSYNIYKRDGYYWYLIIPKKPEDGTISPIASSRFHCHFIRARTVDLPHPSDAIAGMTMLDVLSLMESGDWHKVTIDELVAIKGEYLLSPYAQLKPNIYTNTEIGFSYEMLVYIRESMMSHLKNEYGYNDPYFEFHDPTVLVNPDGYIVISGYMTASEHDNRHDYFQHIPMNVEVLIWQDDVGKPVSFDVYQNHSVPLFNMPDWYRLKSVDANVFRYHVGDSAIPMAFLGSFGQYKHKSSLGTLQNFDFTLGEQVVPVVLYDSIYAEILRQWARGDD